MTYANQVASTLENARLFAETERRLRTLRSLQAIDTAIISSTDLHFTLDTILSETMSQLSLDAADILLFNPQSQLLEFVAGRGFRTHALRHTRLRLGQGYAGQAALERRIVIVPDPANPRSELASSPDLAGEDFQTYYGVPLIAKGTVKGVLELFHRSVRPLGEERQQHLEALTGQTAIAIDNASLFESLQRSNLDLVVAYDATIEGWSHAMDLRDKETEGHSLRVTDMTLQMARAFGMSEPELVHVRRGALLHDIGKMGVPDRILLKPDKLNEEEWVTMKRHPVYPTRC